MDSFCVTFSKLCDGPIEVGLSASDSDMNAPVGSDDLSWSFHSDGYFMHFGDRYDVDGMVGGGWGVEGVAVD